MEANKRVSEIDWSWAVSTINRVVNLQMTADTPCLAAVAMQFASACVIISNLVSRFSYLSGVSTTPCGMPLNPVATCRRSFTATHPTFVLSLDMLAASAATDIQ
jgi:hypothetical protein